MQKILALLKKYKQIVLYLVFGGLTTLVNFAVYYLCAHPFGVSTVASTAIAWFVSVLFAYITNKIWVFESRSFRAKMLIREAAAFFAARAFSGVLDIGNMYLFVDVLHLNDSVIKILSNIVVIIINYVLSKFWIFKRSDKTTR